MLARLGNVLFWASIAFAVYWLIMVFGISFAPYNRGALEQRGISFVLIAAAFPALGSVVIGWSLRYILAGKNRLF
jgi:hypothetical protein